MQIQLKRKWLITIIIILGLAVTNPTESDFKNYLQAKGFSNRSVGRTGYFLIFSIYEANSLPSIIFPEASTSIHQTYIGIFKNFIYIHGK